MSCHLLQIFYMYQHQTMMNSLAHTQNSIWSLNPFNSDHHFLYVSCRLCSSSWPYSSGAPSVRESGGPVLAWMEGMQREHNYAEHVAPCTLWRAVTLLWTNLRYSREVAIPNGLNEGNQKCTLDAVQFNLLPFLDNNVETLLYTSQQKGFYCELATFHD